MMGRRGRVLGSKQEVALEETDEIKTSDKTEIRSLRGRSRVEESKENLENSKPIKSTKVKRGQKVPDKTEELEIQEITIIEPRKNASKKGKKVIPLEDNHDQDNIENIEAPRKGRRTRRGAQQENVIDEDKPDASVFNDLKTEKSKKNVKKSNRKSLHDNNVKQVVEEEVQSDNDLKISVPMVKSRPGRKKKEVVENEEIVLPETIQKVANTDKAIPVNSRRGRKKKQPVVEELPDEPLLASPEVEVSPAKPKRGNKKKQMEEKGVTEVATLPKGRKNIENISDASKEKEVTASKDKVELADLDLEKSEEKPQRGGRRKENVKKSGSSRTKSTNKEEVKQVDLTLKTPLTPKELSNKRKQLNSVEKDSLTKRGKAEGCEPLGLKAVSAMGTPTSRRGHKKKTESVVVNTNALNETYIIDCSKNNEEGDVSVQVSFKISSSPSCTRRRTFSIGPSIALTTHNGTIDVETDVHDDRSCPSFNVKGNKDLFAIGKSDEAGKKKSELRKIPVRVNNIRFDKTVPTTPAKENARTPRAKKSTPHPIKNNVTFSAKKMPNFKDIHKKQFEKMESLKAYKERKAERARALLFSPLSKSVIEPSSSNLSITSKKSGIPIRNSLHPKRLQTSANTTICSFKSHCADVSEIRGKNAEIIKGVRANKRFRLLMQNRNLAMNSPAK